MNLACFLIPKYARKATGGKFFALPCIRKELPVADSLHYAG